ncbi:8748_t:CDS:1, partial [Rhizophagus irregularis]
NDNNFKKSINQNESNPIDDMIIDKEDIILRSSAKLWLKNILEEMGIYTILENFVNTNFIDFIGKEIILQIGGIIQKGLDLNLD